MEKAAKVKLLFFGITHDITNCNELEWEVNSGMTVAGLRAELEKKYPKFRELKSYAVAVNETYAEDNCVLENADDVAIIPPVSGG